MSMFGDAGNMTECEVCYSDVPNNMMVQCPDAHSFCSSCVRNYARHAVYGGFATTNIKCLGGQCERSYHISQLNQLLDKDVIQILLDRIQENNTKTDEHIGKQCEVGESANETLLRVSFEERMSSAKIRQCNECGVELVKIDGCNIIFCQCGTKMCYVCRETINCTSSEHFCLHYRIPGQDCDKCKKNCYLWQNTEEEDARVIKKIEEEAKLLDQNRKSNAVYKDIIMEAKTYNGSALHRVIDLKKTKQKRKEEKKKWKEMQLVRQIEKNLEKEKKLADVAVNSSHDSIISTSNEGRGYTISIAVPGSILDNAQSPELRSYLAGQVARAAAIFCVDEVIVFSDRGKSGDRCDVQLGRILQYLECPQYLRKQYFPQHSDLQYAGLLNPLDCPHHMRMDEESPYREGCVVKKTVKPGKGSYVNCGMRKEVQIDRLLEQGVRVTVKLKSTTSSKKFRGVVVSPASPRTTDKLYWGYTVRLAASLSDVFTQCPYSDTDSGYDITVGTSDKGDDIDTFNIQQPFKHLLVVFGGVAGLEAAQENDEKLPGSDVSSLFTHYLNCCPGQGSRTIRTEEAVLIAMSVLRHKITQASSS